MDSEKLREIGAKVYRYFFEVAAVDTPALISLPVDKVKDAELIATFLDGIRRVPDFDIWKRGIDRAKELLSFPKHGLHRAHINSLWRLAEEAPPKARAKGGYLWVDSIGGGLYNDWWPEGREETVNRSAKRQRPPVIPELDIDTNAAAIRDVPTVYKTPGPLDVEYEPSPAYQKVLVAAKEFLDELHIKLWLGKLEVAELSHEKIVLIAPGEHYVNWITTKYLSVLVRCLEAVFGHLPEIYFGHRKQRSTELFKVNTKRLGELKAAGGLG
jgi:hypothetical protein